eukprot:986239-Amphidinium_carterae.1
MKFFGAFKQRVKKEWTRAVVRQVLSNADSLGVIAPLPQLKTDLLHLVVGVVRALDTWEMRQAQADNEDEHGTLFQDVLPQPEPEEPEWEGEELAPPTDEVEDSFEPAWEEAQVRDVEVEEPAQASLPTNAPAISRFLALRRLCLVCDNPSQAEIQSATQVQPTMKKCLHSSLTTQQIEHSHFFGGFEYV